MTILKTEHANANIRHYLGSATLVFNIMESLPVVGFIAFKRLELGMLEYISLCFASPLWLIKNLNRFLLVFITQVLMLTELLALKVNYC